MKIYSALLSLLLSPCVLAAGVLDNGAVWRDGKPVTLPGLAEFDAPSTIIYAAEPGWAYSHHPFIAIFKGRAYAMWSNGHVDEDAPGQRVLLSTTRDFATWTPAAPLLLPGHDGYGTEYVLTASGFYQAGGTLVAYVASYSWAREDTQLYYVQTEDGNSWTGPYATGLPVVPTHGPVKTLSGRLILPDNFTLPWTDDATGRAGWNLASPFAGPLPKYDDARSFRAVSPLCEVSIVSERHGVLTAAFRDVAAPFSHLWTSESRDDGASWTAPLKSAFSDTNSKVTFGELGAGRRFYLGTPIASSAPRFPLVLSLSTDGLTFNRNFVIGARHYTMTTPGYGKGGEYGYPEAVVDGDFLRVVASRQKEAIEVISVPLSGLGIAEGLAKPDVRVEEAY